jgi:hypothetical protein
MAGAPLTGFHRTFHSLDVSSQHHTERLTAIAAMCEATAVTAGRGLEAVSSRLDLHAELLAGLRDASGVSAIEHARIANAAESLVAILKRRGEPGHQPTPGHITGMHIKTINATGNCNRQSVEGRCVIAAGFTSVFEFESVTVDVFVARLRVSIEEIKVETHAGLFHEATDQDLRGYYFAGVEAATVMRSKSASESGDDVD